MVSLANLYIPCANIIYIYTAILMLLRNIKMFRMFGKCPSRHLFFVSVISGHVLHVYTQSIIFNLKIFRVVDGYLCAVQTLWEMTALAAADQMKRVFLLNDVVWRPEVLPPWPQLRQEEEEKISWPAELFFFLTFFPTSVFMTRLKLSQFREPRKCALKYLKYK